MKTEGLLEDFRRIRRVFPNADLDLAKGWMTIPNLPLPSQFNQPQTTLLFRLFPGSPYNEPHIYVPSALNLISAYGPSGHLDFATESEMAAKGWKRICIKMVWNASHTVLDAVHLGIDFLNNLRG